MLDFKKITRIHFIGIGGVSLSSLALLMRAKGVAVTGSDRVFGEKIPLLTENGCRVWIGERPDDIGSPDLAVYTSAIDRGNSELVRCRSIGIPCLERYVFLGEVAALFGYTVAVAGTHGKTTVTAMLAHVFLKAGLSFYGHIGGDLVGCGNYCYTGDGCFLTEACEYRKSLLTLRPHVGVVLNAEADHPDTFETLSDVYDTFDLFLDNSRIKGIAVTCGDTPYYSIRQAHADTVRYGFGKENRFSASRLYEHKKGYFGFTICDYGNPLWTVELPVPGRHNVLNALACFVVSRLIHIPADTALRALESFPGVSRRFERTSLFMGAYVYSDYAHHPSEIRAAVATARSVMGENKRLYTVFQPHTYSRTARLYPEFCRAFADSDELIIIKEYAARETPDKGLDARALFEGAQSEDKYYFGDVLDTAAHLMRKISPGDVILVLGAGDVVNLCSLLKSD